jgi:hypothetical protein
MENKEAIDNLKLRLHHWAAAGGIEVLMHEVLW